MKAKLMMLGVVAALAMGVMAETVDTIMVSGALVLTNASFVVIVSENFRGVQLWKGRTGRSAPWAPLSRQAFRFAV